MYNIKIYVLPTETSQITYTSGNRSSQFICFKYKYSVYKHSNRMLVLDEAFEILNLDLLLTYTNEISNNNGNGSSQFIISQIQLFFVQWRQSDVSVRQSLISKFDVLLISLCVYVFMYVCSSLALWLGLESLTMIVSAPLIFKDLWNIASGVRWWNFYPQIYFDTCANNPWFEPFENS